ncbi:hypothetical protein AAL_05168 [Moelleriella libera RCEF 2490]|uniref:Uncharacterized protein n=1 Tax=Moelleriella libera RCEF 2490 TaxID=1081109 RepID=A0A168AQ91_9HYPO|nr:hypothetical protein AAL_05168 [Moelleriella libera RCEF 2490]
MKTKRLLCASADQWYDLAKERILGPCDSNSLTTYGPVDIGGPGKFLLSEQSQLAGNVKVAHNNRELTTGERPFPFQLPAPEPCPPVRKHSKRARDLRDFQSPDGGVQVFVAKAEVRDFGRLIARNTSRAAEDTLFSVAPGAMQPVGKAPARQMNFGSFRVGVIGTYDIRTLRILNRARPDTRKSRGDEHLRGLRSKLSNSSVNPPTRSELEAAERERQKATRVEIGTDHVFELIQGNKLGGIQYFFDLAGTDRGVLTLDNPLAWLIWLCDASPILTRTIQLVRRHTQRKERIVVFVDTPWIQ